MTNLNRIVMAGAITIQSPSDYVGRAGELTLNTDTGQLSYHDGVTPGGIPIGGSAVLSTGKISLTTAQLLSLNTSPVTIIPAPGASKYIYVVMSSYELIFGTTPFVLNDGDQGPGLFYGSISGFTADNASGSGAFSASESCISTGTSGYTTSPTTSFENLPVILANGIADMTDGDGIGTMTVIYTVIDL
jgi:hypothetical protein